VAEHDGGGRGGDASLSSMMADPSPEKPGIYVNRDGILHWGHFGDGLVKVKDQSTADAIIDKLAAYLAHRM
jgi:hypothetical protein